MVGSAAQPASCGNIVDTNNLAFITLEYIPVVSLNNITATCSPASMIKTRRKRRVLWWLAVPLHHVVVKTLLRQYDYAPVATAFSYLFWPPNRTDSWEPTVAVGLSTSTAKHLIDYYVYLVCYKRRKYAQVKENTENC